MPNSAPTVLIVATRLCASSCASWAPASFGTSLQASDGVSVMKSVKPDSSKKPTTVAQIAKIISGTVIVRRRFMGMMPGFGRNALFAEERHEKRPKRVKRRQDRGDVATQNRVL